MRPVRRREALQRRNGLHERQLRRAGTVRDAQMIDVCVDASNPGAGGQSVCQQPQGVNRKIDRENPCSRFCD